MTEEYKRRGLYHLISEWREDDEEIIEVIPTEDDMEKAIEARLLKWLETHDCTDENYSDIYKDVYGVRPRW